ncbi:unnamed protein product [Penicillium olsonii]|uniref:Zn(2)-C6 fungal-type domain-containing protein n=1 Tax=Penicillium olsonii TaxID=99116 RepID=A0A9W4HY42_PENOL|nr:unnamed protein product [Penicillium olsonii]CAG8162865.1 unnamed protein product [Penicillium olsonii]
MPSPPPSNTKTRPSALACIGCRKHHLKCDGQKPSCARCISAHTACLYLPSRRGAKRKYENVSHDLPAVDAGTLPSPPQSGQTVTNGRTFQQAMDTIIPDGIHTPQSDPPVSIVPAGRLVRLYYEHFHSAHPILVPSSIYESYNYPPYVHQVVKFIGSHYSVVLDNDVLYESTQSLLSSTSDRTPHMVQALLLYSIIMWSRNQTSEAESSLTKAIDIALELGMHRESFVATASEGKPHEAESMRRTWWSLFIWEIYIGTLLPSTNLQCSDIYSDVCLPCEESDYTSLQTTSQSRSLASFRARIFTEDEGIGQYSSFAYSIEAACILARVIVLNDLPETHHDHLQAVSNTIVSWMNHLPPQKIEIMDMYGNFDEMLFQAHCTIHYATMLLHLPRSNIRPKFPNSMFSICPVAPYRLSPSLTRHVHDVKTIEASKNLSNLLSVRSSAQGYSPTIVFASMLCGLVQLAANEMHGSECFDHHQNRVVLVLGCLKLLREKWRLAQKAHNHLKNVAAQTVTYPAHHSPIPTKRPDKPFGDEGSNVNFDQGLSYLPEDFSDLNNQISSTLLSEFIDPTCGGSFL